MTDAELEAIGYAAARQRFERGDYCDPSELKYVKKWLHTKEKEQEFLAACQRASMSSALNADRAARRSSLIAILVLVISAIGAREQLGLFVRMVWDYFTRM